MVLGCTDGADVGALASNQCDPGLILARCLICRLSLLLVLALLRGFFSGFFGVPPFIKINISKFQFDQDRGPSRKPAKDDVASSVKIETDSFFNVSTVLCVTV